MFSNPFDVLSRVRNLSPAVAAVVQTVVFTLVPGFPDEVWQAINVILLCLIGAIAAEDVPWKLRR